MHIKIGTGEEFQLRDFVSTNEIDIGMQGFGYGTFFALCILKSPIDQVLMQIIAQDAFCTILDKVDFHEYYVHITPEELTAELRKLGHTVVIVNTREPNWRQKLAV